MELNINSHAFGGDAKELNDIFESTLRELGGNMEVEKSQLDREGLKKMKEFISSNSLNVMVK